MKTGHVVGILVLLHVATAQAGVGEWTQKCEQGDGLSCHLVGGIHSAAGDFDAALPLLKRACELGAQCQLGDVADRLHYLGKPLEAKALLDFGCAKRDLVSCGYLADIFAIGDGVAQDTRAALAILGPLCDGGSAVACGSMARIYRDGDGVSVDPTRAAELDMRREKLTRDQLDQNRKADREHPERGQQLGADCSSGKPYACLNAIHFYAYALNDPEQALQFAQEGCRIDPQGCLGWGAVANTFGRAGQDVRARAVLEAACDARQGSACRDRGAYLALGEYGPRDLVTAERLIRPECDAGHVGACHVLGLILSGKRDHKAAHALLVKVAGQRRANQYGPSSARAEAYKQGAKARATQLETDRIAAAVAPLDAILKDLGEEGKAMSESRRPFDRLDAGTLSDVQNLEHYRQRQAAGASTAADWIARRPARQEAIRKLVQELRAAP